jgi:membrane-associated protease RseP (regulator of RpoE activity)
MITTLPQRPCAGRRLRSLPILNVAQPQRKQQLAVQTAPTPIATSTILENVLTTTGGLSLLGFAGLTSAIMGFDIRGPESVLEALGVLAAVVGVHELGHFTAARLQNIHVTKFAIGFGPPLITYQGGEVEYTLRALPLGGFVAFPDDDPDCPYPIDDPDLLRNRPVLDRAIVTIAGVVANCIFAFTICVVQASTIGLPIPTYMPGVKLGPIYPDSVADKSGLRKGDLVLTVGDLKVAPSPSAVDDVVTYIATRPGKSFPVTLEREGQKLSLDITPAEQPDGTGRIGVSLGANVTVERKKASDIGSALSLGAQDFNRLLGTVVKGLSQFVSNFQQTAERVSGPVAILAVGSEVARTDATGLYQFAALINLNLAVVNVLPLPALDGGFLALQFLEVVRGGKKLDENIEKAIMASGFLLLTGTGLFLIARDAVKLIGL